MSILALVPLLLVALLHLWFLVLEMFLWTTPRAMRIFGTTPETAASSRVLAANQGLYNGFLVAGLLWAALSARHDVALFFLGCVFVAGVYGAWSTRKPRIFLVQSVPALIAVAALRFA